jgi:hypothetical protein
MVGWVSRIACYAGMIFYFLDLPRIYDLDRDGKTKIEHVTEMLQNLVYHKNLPFQAVLMDTRGCDK